MKPYSKNYIVGQPLDELGDLMVYLYKNPSVYYKPLNKVMPCKFFMNWAWMSKESFLKNLEDENFFRITKREDVMRSRIRNVLKDCTY